VNKAIYSSALSDDSSTEKARQLFKEVSKVKALQVKTMLLLNPSEQPAQRCRALFWHVDWNIHHWPSGQTHSKSAAFQGTALGHEYSESLGMARTSYLEKKLTPTVCWEYSVRARKGKTYVSREKRIPLTFTKSCG